MVSMSQTIPAMPIRDLDGNLATSFQWSAA